MATKSDSPDKKKVQKAAADVKKPVVQRDSSSAVQQSGLGQTIDSAQQLGSADLVDMHQTYGNSFAQRLMGDGGRGTEDEGHSPTQNQKSKIQNSQSATAMRESDDPVGGRDVDEEAESAIQRTRGQGSSLPDGVKGQMEGQFGADFGGVRLHTDGQADQLSRSLNARSFTTGSDIYFKQGEYDPSGTDGQKLLAHELTHVVQQGGSGAQRKPIQRKLTVNEAGDQYEQEADAMAEQVVKAPQAAPPPAAPPAGGGEASAGAAKAEAKPAGGQEATAVPDSAGQSENLATVTKAMQENPEVADAVAEAKDKAKGELGTEGPALQEAAKAEAAVTGQGPANPEQQTGAEIAEAKQEGKETGEETAEKKEEGEKKEDPEEKAKEQEVKEQGGKLEGNDDSQIKDMKYDPAAVTESDTGPRLPTWSQLAYGTIQMAIENPDQQSESEEEASTETPTPTPTPESEQENPVEQEKEERENLTQVAETEEVAQEQAPAAEEEATAPQMDRGKMILDSIGTGLLQGAVGGAQEMVVDKVFDFATTHGPGKKIPYADGLMAMGQIAMDPNGWWEGGFGQAISAFREGGLFSSEGAWAKIGDEKTWAGKIAGVCEALVATIDLINSILGAIQQVLTIILFILGVTAAILTATGVAAAAAAVILKIIAWIEKILNIIAKIADFLSYGIKPPVQLLAIIFRAVDIAIFEGDPDELMAKQALLTKSVTSFAKDATQRGLQKAYDKGVNKLDNKLLASEKAKKMKEIERVDDTTAPPGKKKQDLVDAYESKYGSSYDADVKRKGKEELTDSDRLADLGAQKKKAQKEFDEATKFKKKDGTAVDEVGAKRAQKQLDDATANFDAAQTRNTQLKDAMTADGTFQGKVTTENATITNKFDTDKGALDTAKTTADTAAPGKLNDHDTAITKASDDLTAANTNKTTKDTAKTTADTEAAQAKTQVDTAKAELKQAKTDLQKAKQDLKNAKTDSEKTAAQTKLAEATTKVQDKTTELGTKQTDLQTKKQTQKQKALEAQQAAQQVEVQKQAKKDAEKAKTDFEAAEVARQKKYDDDVKAAEKKRDDDLSKKKAELENEFEKNWQRQQAEASKTEKDTSKTTSDAAALEQKNKQKDLNDAEAKVSKAEQDIKKAEAAEKQADKQIAAAQRKVDSATDAVNQRTTEFNTAKAKREQLENDLAAATTPEAQKSIQKDLDKARTAETSAQAKKTQAEQKKIAAETAKATADQAKVNAAAAKVTAEGEKTTAEGEKTTAETALNAARTDAETKLNDFTAKQDDFQQKLDKLDELDPAQAKALGKEKAKKSAAEKAGDVFNILSLGTSRALTDSFRGGMYSTRDGTLKQWQNKGWAGQAHASGVTGGSIGMINAAINVATGGDIPSMTEWVGNKINFQKGADEYGAAGIEFDTKWPSDIEMDKLRYSTSKFSNMKNSNTLAEITPDDETKKLWSNGREWPAEAQGIKPKDNPVWAAMPGTYTIEPSEKVGLEGQHVYFTPRGEGDYTPTLDKQTVTVEAGKKETVTVNFEKYVAPTQTDTTKEEDKAQTKRDGQVQRASANEPPPATPTAVVQREPEEDDTNAQAEDVGKMWMQIVLQAAQMQEMEQMGVPMNTTAPPAETTPTSEAGKAEAGKAEGESVGNEAAESGNFEAMMGDEASMMALASSVGITLPDMAAEEEAPAAEEEGEVEAEEEVVVEEEEEGAVADGAGRPDLAALRLKRQREMLDILPEPPDEAEAAVTAAAMGYNRVAVEEEILMMREQQMAALQKDAQSQAMEFEETQKIVAVNEMTIGSFEKGTQQKLEGQEKERQASQEAANPAQKAGSESSGMEGLMQAVMAPLMQIFTTVASKFTDTDTSQAQKNTGEMKNSASKPGDTSDMAARGSQQGIGEANERTAKTMKVQAETERNKKELAQQNAVMEKQKGDAQESESEFGDLSAEAAATRASMQADKDMLASEHETASAELEAWAAEHQAMRMELFANLDAEVSAYQEQ